jgi:hypothetical protein
MTRPSTAAGRYLRQRQRRCEVIAEILQAIQEWHFLSISRLANSSENGFDMQDSN